jgi:uncharacterized membrane protein
MGRWCNWLTLRSPKASDRDSNSLRPATKIVLYLAILGKFFDSFGTYLGYRLGVAEEKNYIPRLTIEQWGIGPAMLFNFIVSALLLWALYVILTVRKRNPWMLYVLCGMVWIVVNCNTYQTIKGLYYVLG